MPGPGTWYVTCESDPRWNGSGRAIIDGLFGCREMDDHIAQMRKELGEPPPDAVRGCMKD